MGGLHRWFYKHRDVFCVFCLRGDQGLGNIYLDISRIERHRPGERKRKTKKAFQMRPMIPKITFVFIFAYLICMHVFMSGILPDLILECLSIYMLYSMTE